jgi:hypothetical protein
MHRSSDLIDEPSRLKQFAWEQWDDQVIAVILRYVDDRRKLESVVLNEIIFYF